MNMKQSMWTPLSPTVLYALIVLYHQSVHAYLVGEQIAMYSQGLITPNRSTTGRLLKRLVRRGWVAIESLPAYPQSSRRQIYKLTPVGNKVLSNELERLRYLVNLTNCLMFHETA